MKERGASVKEREIFGIDYRFVVLAYAFGLLILVATLFFNFTANQRERSQRLLAENKRMSSQLRDLSSRLEENEKKLRALAIQVKYLDCVSRGGTWDFGSLTCSPHEHVVGSSKAQ